MSAIPSARDTFEEYITDTKTLRGNAIQVQGPTAIAGTLAVVGNATVSGTQTVGGALSVAGTSTLTGATTLGSTLSVAGAATLTGAGTLGGTPTVGGAATVTGGAAVGGSLAVTGPASVGGALRVTGATTLTGAASVGGSLTVGGDLTVAGSTAQFAPLEPFSLAESIDYFGTFLGHNQRCVRVGDTLYAVILITSAGDSPRSNVDFTAPSTALSTDATILYNPSTKKAYPYVDALPPHPGLVKLTFNSVWALLGSANGGRSWTRLLTVQYAGQDVRPPCIEAWDGSTQGSRIYIMASTTTGDNGALTVTTYAPVGLVLGAALQTCTLTLAGAGKFTSYILRCSAGAALLVSNHNGNIGAGNNNVFVLPLNTSTGALKSTADTTPAVHGGQFVWAGVLAGATNYAFQLLQNTGSDVTPPDASQFLQYPYIVLDESTAANHLLFGMVNVSYGDNGGVPTEDYSCYSAVRFNLADLWFYNLDGTLYGGLPVYTTAVPTFENATLLSTSAVDASLSQFMNALAGTTHYVHSLADEKTGWGSAISCRYIRRPKADVGGGGAAITTLALTSTGGDVLQRGYRLYTWGTAHLYAVGQPVGDYLSLILLHSGDEGSTWTKIASSAFNNKSIYNNVYGVSGCNVPIWYAGQLSIVLIVGLYKNYSGAPYAFQQSTNTNTRCVVLNIPSGYY